MNDETKKMISDNIFGSVEKSKNIHLLERKAVFKLKERVESDENLFNLLS